MDARLFNLLHAAPNVAAAASPGRPIKVKSSTVHGWRAAGRSISAGSNDSQPGERTMASLVWAARTKVRQILASADDRRHAAVGPMHLWRMKREFQIAFLAG